MTWQIKVRKVISKCKSVSNLVRRSEGNRDALRQAWIQTNTDFVLPIKPADTCWNLTEAKLYSCLCLQSALSHLHFYDRSNTWSDCIPSVREFDVVEAVQKCIQPLKIASKTFEQIGRRPFIKLSSKCSALNVSWKICQTPLQMLRCLPEISYNKSWRGLRTAAPPTHSTVLLTG